MRSFHGGPGSKQGPGIEHCEEPLLGLSQEQIGGIEELLGQPGYRAKQVAEWLYIKKVVDPSRMTNLPRSLREQLAARRAKALPGLKRVDRAADGTRKLLFRLHDGLCVEGVLIPQAEHSGEVSQLTMCVSSQVGCPFDCLFCRTGGMGLLRNLTVAEILAQVVIGFHETGEAERLSRLVFMGMGEPLLNYRNVVAALKLLVGPRGMGFGPPRITVSTAGIPEQMVRLRELMPVQLAVSLGGCTEAKRAGLMPAAHRRASLAEVLDACRSVKLGSRERITFEMVMVRGVNDSDSDAREFLRRTGGIRCKFNLLPLNEHPGTSLRAPPEERLQSFQQVLVKGGRPASIRRSRGIELLAACGQLATESQGRLVSSLAFRYDKPEKPGGSHE